MIWRRKIIKKHVLKSDKTRPPVTAPAPPPSIPGTMCAPVLAARISPPSRYCSIQNLFERLIPGFADCPFLVVPFPFLWHALPAVARHLGHSEVSRLAEQHPPAAFQLDHQRACGYRGREPRVGVTMTSSVTSPSQGTSWHSRRQI
jgi:hypothetical protein